MQQLPEAFALIAEAPATGQATTLEWTAVVAIALIGIHLFVPRLRPFMQAREEVLGSLGRGLAVAYVFLHLFQELDEGQELIGPRIHFIVLVGFLLYYGVEHYVQTRVSADTPDASTRLHFAVLLLLKWIYSWLIIYALPESIKREGLYLVPAIIAISLHILHDDVALAGRFERDYDRVGRYVLATGPLIGWLTDVVFFEENPLISNILMALLAGFVLYSTFSGELREHRKSRFSWFITGVVVYSALHLLSESG